VNQQYNGFSGQYGGEMIRAQHRYLYRRGEMLQKPRGTRDFLPDEMERRRFIEQNMRDSADRWGYREIQTPTFETLELFTIRSGEGIIQEMYAFEDKGGRHLALRPEVTASVLRMYVNEGRMLPKPVRWCYFADCYRYERPQMGRFRQFWQFGVELIGADTPAADAEVILLADDIFRTVGISFETQIGHLAPMKHILGALQPDVQRKVMAFLDKRDFTGLEQCLGDIGRQELCDSLIGLTECSEVDEVFSITGEIPEQDRICETLDIIENTGMDYTLNFGIARGLDYYTGMVFECFAPNLGAENQILGGGAYRLAHLFGGEDVPSCGFAIGFDRVLVSLGQIPMEQAARVAVLYTPEGKNRAFEVACLFRNGGISAELNLTDRGIGAQMKHASKSADFAVIVGVREVNAGTVTLRNLHSGTQQESTPEEALAEVRAFGTR
jgi:histidyl-tRNA synthetase